MLGLSDLLGLRGDAPKATAKDTATADTASSTAQEESSEAFSLAYAATSDSSPKPVETGTDGTTMPADTPDFSNRPLIVDPRTEQAGIGVDDIAFAGTKGGLVPAGEKVQTALSPQELSVQGVTGELDTSIKGDITMTGKVALASQSAENSLPVALGKTTQLVLAAGDNAGAKIADPVMTLAGKVDLPEETAITIKTMPETAKSAPLSDILPLRQAFQAINSLEAGTGKGQSSAASLQQVAGTVDIAKIDQGAASLKALNALIAGQDKQTVQITLHRQASETAETMIRHPLMASAHSDTIDLSAFDLPEISDLPIAKADRITSASLTSISTAGGDAAQAAGTTTSLTAAPGATAPGQQVMTSPAQMLANNPAMQAQAMQQVTAALGTAQKTPGRMEIQLDPPELGRVTIDFRFEGDHRVVAIVSADQPETANLMRRSLDVLMRDLNAAGFTDVDLSMGKEQQGFNGHNMQQDSSSGQGSTARATMAMGELGHASGQTAEPIQTGAIYRGWASDTVDIRL